VHEQAAPPDEKIKERKMDLCQKAIKEIVLLKKILFHRNKNFKEHSVELVHGNCFFQMVT